MIYFNRKTRITASILGVLLGLSSLLNHGLFEVLQGYNPTGGLFIEAIGEAHRFWLHGTEAAFTLIPNYLVTGIFVILVALALIIWSLKYMHVRRGSTVFLSLLILLTLVGGGIGYILLYLPAWAFSTRINKPLNWWKRNLSLRIRNSLSDLWPFSMAATSISWIMVMELGIFGYFPGQSDPDTILNIVFIFLFSTVILASFTFICAFASDIKASEK